MIGNRAERPAFGALLRRHRIEAGLSQELLAERARISVQAVSALERGARSAPRADTLALLVQTLALTGDERSEFEETARASVKPRVRMEQPLLRRSEARPVAFDGPHFSTQFIGRLGDLEELEELVQPGRCTTLWGTGGIGKTRLAVELAKTLPESVRGDVVFVPLASTISDDSVESAVAAALGIAARPGQELLAQIEAALADRAGMLIVDNCEHVIAGAARFVERLLARAPRLAVLCTSREPLRIGGERVFRMKTLALDDSMKLFIDRAAAASAAREPSLSERRSIETICRRLDGLPLSLELAAACTRALDVANIERALDERFDVLARGSRTVEARHLTLRATIAWSYDLLEPIERRVFERVAIFNGRFTFDDALAVATDETTPRGAAIAALAALVDKALVMLDATPGAPERSYRLLESTRAFAGQIAPGDTADSHIEAAKQRLGAHLVNRVIAASDVSRGGDDTAIRALDVDVLRGYLQWALSERNDPARGTLLAGRLMIFWDFSGLHLEGLGWIERGLSLVPPDASDRVPELAALIGTSRLQQRLSRFAESVPPAERAYEIAKACGDGAYRAAAAYLLGLAHTLLGDHDRAFVYVEEALAAYVEVGDEVGRVNARDVAAIVAFRSGRVETGRRLYAQGIEEHQSAGRRRSAASNMMDLAEAEFSLGNATTAIARVRPGIEEMRASGTPLLVAFGLVNEAAYLLDSGHTDEALASVRESLQLAVDGKFGQCLLLCMQAIAAVAIIRGDDDEGPAELSGYLTLAMERSFPELGFTEKRVRDRLQAELAAALPPSAIAEAATRGVELDEDAALALACALGGITLADEGAADRSTDVA